MAKTNNLGLWRFILAAAVILAAALTTFLLTQAKADSNESKISGAFSAIKSVKVEAEKDLHELEEDGCDPSGVNKIDIVMVQKDVGSLQVDVTEIKGDVKEILRRLPVK